MLYGGTRFDGCSEPQYGCALGDFWGFNGEAWNQIETVHDPGPRMDHGLVYDPHRNRTVLFAGWDFDAEDDDYVEEGIYEDTWEYDGNQWVNLTGLLEQGAEYPSLAANNYDLIYDSLNHQVMMIAVSVLTSESELWVYDGQAWTEMDSADHENDGDPLERMDSAFVFDVARGVPILFGGEPVGLPYTVPPHDNEACSTAYGRACDDVWEFHSGKERTFALDLAHVFIEPHQTLAGLEFTLVSHVQPGAQTVIHGVRGSQKVLAENLGTMAPGSESPSGMVSHHLRVTSPAQLARLLQGNRKQIRFSVEDQSNGITGPKRAVPALDYAEFRIQYQPRQTAPVPEGQCGDGVTDLSTNVPEVCDDGNSIDGDYCSADCQTKGSCGDGAVQAAAGEVCDGPTDDHRACVMNCRFVGGCAMGYQDDGTGACAALRECGVGYQADAQNQCTLCAEGYHDDGSGDTCVTEGLCAEGYKLDDAGACSLCDNDYHNGGDGKCVPEGTCATNYHDGGEGECVFVGTCSEGFHDADGFFDSGDICGIGGNGDVCVPDDQCADGFHNGGNGTCVPVGECCFGFTVNTDGECSGCGAGYHNGGDGVCVFEGTCSEGYHNGGDDTCVEDDICIEGYHDGGDGVCVLNGTCSSAYSIDDGSGECSLCNVEGGYHEGGPAGLRSFPQASVQQDTGLLKVGLRVCSISRWGGQSPLKMELPAD